MRRKITPGEYWGIRFNVEEILSRLPEIVNHLRVMGTALKRVDDHKPNIPAVCHEDIQFMNSCAEVATKAAVDLSSLHETVLEEMPEISFKKQPLVVQ